MSNPDMTPFAHNTAALRQCGLRVTAPRLAALAAVSEHPHADVETIRSKVATRLGSVSTQTIYDTLNVLCEVGLVKSLAPEGSPARYELNSHDNHHHMVCRNCSEIRDVPCATGYAPCLDPLTNHGYVIDRAEVIYWGLCAKCAEN